MILEVMKETKRYGHTDGRSDNMQTVYPPTNTVCGGYKKVTKPGLEPMTSGLEKPVLLSTRLNTIIAITKYEGENYNIQTAIIPKKSYDFFLNFHHRIFSLYSTS